MRLWVTFFVVLASSSAAPAATPVDLYQGMESGSDGDLLTPTLMNAGSHGTGATHFSRRSPLEADAGGDPGTRKPAPLRITERKGENREDSLIRRQHSKPLLACGSACVRLC
jgi:hypothetical protein